MPDLSPCADLARTADHDRFLCALFAPEPARGALMALLAFNQEIGRIPELVSEPLAGRIRLQWWRDALAADTAPDHPIGAPLHAALRDRILSRECLVRYLAARERDLEPEGPADLAALEAYARDTAGALTEAMAGALGLSQAETLAAARAVGTAWGLVGLLRAVPFQAAAGRCPLPVGLAAEHGLTLPPRRDDPALSAVVAVVVETARDHLRAARRLRRAVPRRAFPALAPALLADGWLRQLERVGFDPYRLETRSGGGVWRFIRLLAVGGLAGRW